MKCSSFSYSVNEIISTRGLTKSDRAPPNVLAVIKNFNKAAHSKSNFSKTRSNTRASKSCCQMKGLARRNTPRNMKALPPTNQKLWPKLEVFLKIGQTQRSKVRESRSWYQMKGLTRRNTHVKYEGPITYQSKVINQG